MGRRGRLEEESRKLTACTAARPDDQAYAAGAGTETPSPRTYAAGRAFRRAACRYRDEMRRTLARARRAGMPGIVVRWAAAGRRCAITQKSGRLDFVGGTGRCPVAKG